MKQRIMTAIIAASGFVGLLYLGGFWFSALLLAMSLVAMHEYIKISQLREWHAASWISYFSLVCIVFPWDQLNINLWLKLESSLWFIMLILFILTVLSKNKLTIHHSALYLTGIIYIGSGFHFMMKTIWLEHAHFWTLFIFVCIWATDSGAYFTGSAIGKHKLWPAISPKKTVEGALGGILFAIVAAIIFALISPELLHMKDAMFIGLIIAIASQIGDLIESAFKRSQGVKDSGSILPGHGGILDRTDSWLIVFPLIHFIFFMA